MAKKDKNEEQGNELPQRVGGPPPDLSNHKRANPELQGWAVAEQDIWLSGVVVGVKRSVDEKKTMAARKRDPKAAEVMRVQYLLQLTAPAKVVRPNAPEGEFDIAKENEIIALDHRDGYKVLAEYAENPGSKHVHIHFMNKISIGGGQTFWKVEVYEADTSSVDDELPI